MSPDRNRATAMLPNTLKYKSNKRFARSWPRYRRARNRPTREMEPKMGKVRASLWVMFSVRWSAGLRERRHPARTQREAGRDGAGGGKRRHSSHSRILLLSWWGWS